MPTFRHMTSSYIRGDKQISSGGIMKPSSIVPSGLTANRVTQIPMDLLSSCFHGEIQYISIWYVWTLGILHFWTKPYPHITLSVDQLFKRPDQTSSLWSTWRNQGNLQWCHRSLSTRQRRVVMRNQMMLLSATINDHKMIINAFLLWFAREIAT